MPGNLPDAKIRLLVDAAAAEEELKKMQKAQESARKEREQEQKAQEKDREKKQKEFTDRLKATGNASVFNPIELGIAGGTLALGLTALGAPLAPYFKAGAEAAMKGAEFFQEMGAPVAKGLAKAMVDVVGKEFGASETMREEIKAQIDKAISEPEGKVAKILEWNRAWAPTFERMREMLKASSVAGGIPAQESVTQLWTDLFDMNRQDAALQRKARHYQREVFAESLAKAMAARTFGD